MSYISGAAVRLGTDLRGSESGIYHLNGVGQSCPANLADLSSCIRSPPTSSMSLVILQSRTHEGQDLQVLSVLFEQAEFKHFEIWPHGRFRLGHMIGRDGETSLTTRMRLAKNGRCSTPSPNFQLFVSLSTRPLAPCLRRWWLVSSVVASWVVGRRACCGRGLRTLPERGQDDCVLTS
jgi:hypothetical protein